jgi:GTP cyclohydrolase IA
MMGDETFYPPEPIPNHARDLLCSVIPGFEERYMDGDQHVQRTPIRFANMLSELTTPQEFDFTIFDNRGCDEMVTVGPIPFTAVCAHHIIPFVGQTWVGYIPDKMIVGLSKIPRCVINKSKGIWTQEELTNDIASFLEKQLEPIGVAVVMKAEHMCMTIRGVQVPGTMTTTSAMRGVFLEKDNNARHEFLELIR